MTSTMWAPLTFVGIGLVVISNALRARRTGDRSCLGHFFVPSEKMTLPEQILNRGGIAVFVGSVMASLLA